MFDKKTINNNKMYIYGEYNIPKKKCFDKIKNI